MIIKPICLGGIVLLMSGCAQMGGLADKSTASLKARCAAPLDGRAATIRAINKQAEIENYEGRLTMTVCPGDHLRPIYDAYGNIKLGGTETAPKS